MLAVHFNCLLPVRGFGHHRHIGLHIHDGGHADPRHQMVFSDQYSYLAHGNGTITSTSVPSPGWLARCSSPPSRSARSRMPSSPKCPPTVENTSFCSNPRPSSLMRKYSFFGSRCRRIQRRFAPACLSAFVTASCAMRSKCCSYSCGRSPGSPLASTSSCTPDPAVHSLVPDSSADARSCPSSTLLRRSITLRRASV